MSTTPENQSPAPAPRKGKANAPLRRSNQSCPSSDQDGEKNQAPVNQFPNPEIISDIKRLLNSADLSQKKMAQDLSIRYGNKNQNIIFSLFHRSLVQY